MIPSKTKLPLKEFSLENIKIPIAASKGTPNDNDSICALWVFQNCAEENETKLKRIVSLVRTRNNIDWLPVTTDGKLCIVTYLGSFSNLVKLRSSVFGLNMESFSFKPNEYWITPPKEFDQFMGFFDVVKSDLQASEKRLLQKREMEIKSKSLKVSPLDYNETESVELNETDIDDLRKELNAISSL